MLGLARWCMAHRRRVVVAWVAVAIITTVVAQAVGPNYVTVFGLPGTESQRAVDLLKREFRTQSGDVDTIVVHVSRGTIDSPAVRRAITPLLARVRALPHVATVVSPYAPGGAVQVSPDRMTGFATINYDKPANELSNNTGKPLLAGVAGVHIPGLQVAAGGQVIENAEGFSVGPATEVGVLAALLILLLTFGSLAAAGMPLVTAGLGLITGVGLIGLATHLTNMSNISPQLALMIGLGVGIDYSLFIVTRFRESYLALGDVERSVVEAMDTSGRAILLAGATVVIALLGMFATGVAFMYGLAIASVVAVLLVLVASLTLLPALLSRFGPRLVRSRGNRRGRRRRAAAPATDGAGARGRSLRRFGVAAVERGRPGTAVAAGDRVADADDRAGGSGVRDAAGQQRRRQRSGQRQLAPRFRSSGQGLRRGIQRATTARRATAGTCPDIIAAGAAGRGPLHPPCRRRHAAPDRAVGQHRRDAGLSRLGPPGLDDHEPGQPLARRRATGVQAPDRSRVLVGGFTAGSIDFSHVLSSKLPLFFGIVILLSAALLFVIFRSLVIPIQAAIMNLLTIGAALGVTVAVFQDGLFASVLGVQKAPIEPWVPVIMFAVVFGLSMDYEVFLVSRVREQWMRRGDASEAVVDAIALTGRVISAAAAIMVCVFLSFTLSNQRTLKEFGFGLAVAVLLDALVVRCALLPAVLELLGPTTWRLPRWLDARLPHINIEGSTARAEPDTPPSAVGETAQPEATRTEA